MYSKTTLLVCGRVFLLLLGSTLAVHERVNLHVFKDQPPQNKTSLPKLKRFGFLITWKKYFAYEVDLSMATMLGHESPQKQIHRNNVTTPSTHHSEVGYLQHQSRQWPRAVPSWAFEENCGEKHEGCEVKWHLFTAIEDSWWVVEPPSHLKK